MVIQKAELAINTATKNKDFLPPIFSAVEAVEDFGSIQMAVGAKPPPSEALTNAPKRFWRIYRVSGKIIEAKSLPKQDETHNYYCIARMDNAISNQVISMAVSNTDSPFWAEEFLFDTKNGFRDVKFIVMMEKTNAGITHTPIGKVVIPRNFIKYSSDEQCFLLFDASLEWKVTGSVLLQIKHFPPKAPRKIHGFSVTVQRAKDLDKNGEDIPNPYAVIHLLPDPEAITTQHTHVIDASDSPKFKEVFFFTCSEQSDPNTRDINCALWSQNESGPEFLGHVTIPMAPVVAKGVVNRWYNLTCLENDSEFMMSRHKNKKHTHDEEKKGKGAKELRQEDERRNKTRDFVKSLHAGGSLINPGAHAVTDRPHDFVEKSFVLTPCFVCNAYMTGAHAYCTECHINVHQKCGDGMENMCGAVGSIRLKVVHQKFIAFTKATYHDLIELLRKDDFFLLNLLGKVSSNREDVAKCMIRIFAPTFQDFLRVIIRQEIMQSPDSKTLFRANSMASKGLDLYMKHVGLDYLQGTVENVLKLFVMSKKGFEMDPTRIDTSGSNGAKDKKGKFVEETIEGNTANLMELNTIVTEHIFKSVSKFPKQLRDIFSLIQKTVVEKFPEDEMVRYTSVSGFLFLRFFAPAILGPHLFGLHVGFQDAQSSRKLLMIAKTLQNLSNFVEFGQKEPFMEPMNSFIQSRMGAMRHFIDEVSQPLTAEEASSLPPENHKEEDVAQDCAELSLVLAASMERLVAASTPPFPLVLELGPILKTIEANVKEIEKLDQSRNELYDMENDIGVDLLEDNSETPALDMEEETKILKALTRIQSEIDTAESNGSESPASPSPAQYRNAFDLKDTMTKGHIQTIQISVTPVHKFFGDDYTAHMRKKELQVHDKSGSLSSLSKEADDSEFPANLPIVDGASSNPFAPPPANPFAPPPDEDTLPAEYIPPPSSGKRRTSKQFFGSLLGGTPSESPAPSVHSKRRPSTMAMVFGTGSHSGSDKHSGSEKSSVVVTKQHVAERAFTEPPVSSSVDHLSTSLDVRHSATAKPRVSAVFSSPLRSDLNDPSPIETAEKNGRTSYIEPKKLPSQRGSTDSTNSESESATGGRKHSEGSGDSILLRKTSKSQRQRGSSLGQHSVTPETIMIIVNREEPVEEEGPEYSDANINMSRSNTDINASQGSFLSFTGGNGTNEDGTSVKRKETQSKISHGATLSPTGSSSPTGSRKTVKAIREVLFQKDTYSGSSPDISGSSNNSSPGSGKKSLFARGASGLKSFHGGVPGANNVARGSVTSKLTGCPRCKLETDGNDQVVVVEHMKFHLNCMTCATCHVDLKEEAYSWKDDIYCENDYFNAAGLVCPSCDLPIAKDFIAVGGKKYHPSCRDCSLCKASLAGKDFAVLGNAVFCHEHKDCIPCFGCHKKIEGALVESNDRFYHPNHFSCFQCSKDLNGCVSYEYNVHPFCQRCYMNLDPSDVLKNERAQALGNEMLSVKIAQENVRFAKLSDNTGDAKTPSEVPLPKLASRKKSMFISPFSK